MKFSETKQSFSNGNVLNPTFSPFAKIEWRKKYEKKKVKSKFYFYTKKNFFFEGEGREKFFFDLLISLTESFVLLRLLSPE